MSLRSIPLLLLVFPLALTAQGRQGVIYKCRDASGHVSYQSQICPPGTEVRDLKVFTDPGIDPDISRQVEQNAADLAARRGRSSRSSYSFGSPNSESEKVRRCRAAKEERKRVLDSLGLRTTYDLRRTLDDKVYDACKYAPGA